MPSGFTARPRRPFVPSVRIPDGPCERPRGSRSCSRRGVNNATELSTSDCKSLIFKYFLTTRHSHSIVNSRAPLIGRSRSSRPFRKVDTDKTTVAVPTGTGAPFRRSCPVGPPSPLATELLGSSGTNLTVSGGKSLGSMTVFLESVTVLHPLAAPPGLRPRPGV